MNKLNEIMIKWRVIYIAVIVFFMGMTWHTVSWFQVHHSELSEAAAAGFISIVLSLVGSLKYALENLGNDRGHQQY